MQRGFNILFYKLLHAVTAAHVSKLGA